MIKNIKQNSFKPENNFNVSSINLTNEEKFKEKINEHKQLGKNINWSTNMTNKIQTGQRFLHFLSGKGTWIKLLKTMN